METKYSQFGEALNTFQKEGLAAYNGYGYNAGYLESMVRQMFALLPENEQDQFLSRMKATALKMKALAVIDPA